MKRTHSLLAILLLLGLSACGGTANTNQTANQNAAIELTENEINQVWEETQNEDNAGAEETGGNCYNEYYPVKSGASWSYSMNSSMTGEDFFTRSIVSSSDTGFIDQDAWAVGTVRTGEWNCDNGNLTALSQGGMGTVDASGGTFEATSQESSGVTYPSPLQVGTSWSQHLIISGDMVVTDGMSSFATNDTTQSCTAIAEESISVPAGTFDAIKLNCNSTMIVTVEIEGMAIEPTTINSTSQVWLVKDVGMVKIVDNNDFTDTSIELSSYSIP